MPTRAITEKKRYVIHSKGIQANHLGARCSWKARQTEVILHPQCWDYNKEFIGLRLLWGLEGKQQKRNPYRGFLGWGELAFWFLLHMSGSRDLLFPVAQWQGWQAFTAKADGIWCETQHVSSLALITFLLAHREGPPCAKWNTLNHRAWHWDLMT